MLCTRTTGVMGKKNGRDNWPSGREIAEEKEEAGEQARTVFCDLSSAAKLQLGEQRKQTELALFMLFVLGNGEGCVATSLFFFWAGEGSDAVAPAPPPAFSTTAQPHIFYFLAFAAGASCRLAGRGRNHHAAKTKADGRVLASCQLPVASCQRVPARP